MVGNPLLFFPPPFLFLFSSLLPPFFIVMVRRRRIDCRPCSLPFFLLELSFRRHSVFVDQKPLYFQVPRSPFVQVPGPSPLPFFFFLSLSLLILSHACFFFSSLLQPARIRFSRSCRRHPSLPSFFFFFPFGRARVFPSPGGSQWFIAVSVLISLPFLSPG